jgi:hypothetical protein
MRERGRDTRGGLEAGAGGSRVGRPVRHGVAAGIFWLLPLLAFAGMLAPGLVQVAYQEEEELQVAQRSGTVLFRPVRLNRPPLVVPRDYSTGFIPELMNLESLFKGTEYRGELGRQLGDLPSFPSRFGDMIVIDDVDTFVADQFFKDLLKPTFVADRGQIWDPDIFDVIPPLFPVGNNNRYDDFPGFGIDPSGGVVVPEPATGLLLTLGLALLAGSRRSPLRRG